MKQSFTERMAEGRDGAQVDRNKGLHTGKMAAGWNVKRPKEHANDNCAWLLNWRKHWQAMAAEIQLDFVRRCFNSDNPDTWEI